MLKDNCYINVCEFPTTRSEIKGKGEDPQAMLYSHAQGFLSCLLQWAKLHTGDLGIRNGLENTDKNRTWCSHSL